MARNGHKPAVRFALVRDGLTGLEAEHAAEVADAIHEYCNVEDALRDPEADPELRAGAELIQRHRRSGG